MPPLKGKERMKLNRGLRLQVQCLSVAVILAVLISLWYGVGRVEMEKKVRVYKTSVREGWR